MAYLKIIESNTEWICPKDATYKVICVAGGPNAPEGIGCVEVKNQIKAGGPTLFGNLISATGMIGGSTRGCYISGYTISGYANVVSGGFAYPVINPIGYGGGGIAYINNSNSINAAGPGKLNIGFFEITKGTSINCVIGQPAPKLSSSNVCIEGNPGVIVIQEAGPIEGNGTSSADLERFTYELYNGSNKIKTGAALSGSEITLPSLTTSNDDQRFAGWRVNASGTVYNTKYIVTSDCKLYAYFVAK